MGVRIPSALFDPGPMTGPGSFELLSMAPETRAIYEASRRNTPWGNDVDKALEAHRNAHGDIEQILRAQRVDPCDAMRGRPSERYRAYVAQRRYAVKAYTEAGLPASGQARVLGVSISTIRNDIRVLRGLSALRGAVADMRARSVRASGLAGNSPAQVQALLGKGLSQRDLAEQFNVTRQAVSSFCKRHRLRRPSARPYSNLPAVPPSAPSHA
ncbi:hypothetical protein ACTT2I_10575 [Stenotrophomonas sp. PUT21]|uniref:hypothetical protein n=1 Tax=Stenotrophomonas sp. PUT21 TaxID=3456954 RepID=UPI003FCE8F02